MAHRIEIGEVLKSNDSDDVKVAKILEALYYLLNTTEQNTVHKAGLYTQEEARQSENNICARGPAERYNLTRAGKIIDLVSKINSDIFLQPKLLINGVEIRHVFYQGSDEFRIMKTDQDMHKVEIMSAALYIKKITMSPSLFLGHETELQQRKALYTLAGSELRIRSLPVGNLDACPEDLFSEKIPFKVVVAFVPTLANQGAFKRDLYRFVNCDIETATLTVNGTQRVDTFDFNNNLSHRSYFTLLEQLCEKHVSYEYDQYVGNKFLLEHVIVPARPQGTYGVEVGHYLIGRRRRRRRKGLQPTFADTAALVRQADVAALAIKITAAPGHETGAKEEEEKAFRAALFLIAPPDLKMNSFLVAVAAVLAGASVVAGTSAPVQKETLDPCSSVAPQQLPFGSGVSLPDTSNNYRLSTVYDPNTRQVTVTLQGLGVNKFTRFVIRALNNKSPGFVNGQFSNFLSTVKSVSCDGIQNSAIANMDDSEKDSVTAIWTPPLTELDGQIKFKATVVKAGASTTDVVESPVTEMSRLPGVPARQVDAKASALGDAGRGTPTQKRGRAEGETTAATTAASGKSGGMVLRPLGSLGFITCLLWTAFHLPM
ncbi:uncharacterized protein LOC135398663 [Ornithodoros turicata]|uniref:uncharacterized protein LOC135398663 n=1 Tax=Ornithodoros turicata TaxID=34597 RepID=UPI0031388A45